ncbi:g-type lectin s-receptor-like serine/threonine-protein kinase sd3-1 [Phtheirospermum japonicum]|uniref:Receptor-like serine/threonine-protein kinase n=1 Tax=Phtheirospermum japonicum TaxID=374723 RepID=A0A830BYD5_9LAMI|nr:g-type lectin s-receptor-like serine/threonine-protein kinase sd3-1 [Phtheirospermum japonicum]
MCFSWLSVKSLTTKGLTKYHLTRYFSLPLILLFLCFLFSGVSCDNDFTMPLGSEINAFAHSDNNKNWVSKNGVFAFGFLEIDGTDDVDEYVVGVKYNLGDKFANLPVWTVDGGIRVSSNSTFKLAIDGTLILTDNLSKITLWSSNTSNSGVEKASLLDNGNFVLLGSKNEVIWESFGSPTNTLLPGQALRYPQNLRALSTKSISSYYSLLITKSGELKLLWEHNVTYWRSHFRSNEARFDSNGVFGLYDESNNKAVWFVTSRDYEDPSVNLRHLRIDQDGNLRIYSWDNAGHAWKPVWQAVEDQCSVFASCGLYSVCGYNSSGPVCECLDSGSLESEISGPGCKKMVDLGNCRMRTSIWAMKQTVLYGLYPSHDDEMLLSETSCKEFCTNDTSCIAATSMNDGSGRCTIKRTAFVSGYKNPYIHAVSFLKVCSVPQAAVAQGANNGMSMASSGGATFEKGSSKKLIGAIALIALLTVLVILSIQFLVFSILYHKRKVRVRTRIPFGKDAKMDPHYSVLVRLSSEEIKELTNDFTNRIGSSVFRGELPNKIPIVAKVLKDVVVSEKEFRVTVSTLSGTHHRNLVSVKGFCFELANKILLYEYVPNGSLDKWLFDTGENHNGQIWQQKLDIALGIARGLAYLHTECQKCVTHGNLKLENVLLDENLVPKLTDFGLRDLQTKQNAANSSSESASERDIYELGQMFLQILTCKREVIGENMRNILERVNREEKKGDVDGESLEAIERIARISFWCMQSQPFLRPSTGEVVKVLEGTLSVDRPPSHLVTRRDVSTTEAVSEIEAEC